MDATDVYPSSWLKAADVGKKKSKLTIVEVKVIRIKENDPQKLELHFDETDKALVLNKTNASRLIESLGKETSGWIGKTIELYTITTDYKGEEVQAIRIRVPSN